MKNYSYSNTATEESYPTRKSTDLSNCYRHSELKAKEANQRIQEIKRKYETPNRRERIDSLKKSELHNQPRTPYMENGKQNTIPARDSSAQGLDKYLQHQPAPTFGANPLKESFAVNRLEKSMLRNDVDCKHLDNLRRSNDKRYPFEDRKNMYDFKSHSREDEEALFSKVREMKESLINQDLMKGSVHCRGNNSSYKYSHEPRPEARNFDPRVENIDKINSKIKQILNCLAENEKNPSKYTRQSPQSKYQKEQYRHSALNSQAFTRQSYNQDHTKSLYLHTEEDRLNRVMAPLATVPSEKKIEESSVYNFYKNAESKQESALRSTYHQCKTTPNEQTPVLKYKIEEIEHSRLRDRDHSVGRCEGYASKLLRQREEISRTPSCIQGKQYEHKSAIRGSRSRSHMAGSKSVITDTEKDVLRSGKKLTEQISKIQNRIQELESEKKKLNISFTPFTHKSNRSSSALATYQVSSSIDTNKFSAEEKTQVPHFRSSSTTKERHLTAHFGNSKEQEGDISKPAGVGKYITKSVEPQQPKTSLQSQNRPSFDISLENVDFDVKTVRIDKPDEQCCQENTFTKEQEEYSTPAMGKEISFAYDEVKRRTDDGIQERKRKLQHTEIIKTDGLKKLVGLFCEQAKFDEHLRNLKIWFQAVADRNKFSELSSILNGFGCTLSEEQCRKIFTVEESEHNPFFSVQGFEGTTKGLAKAFSEADSHWNESIKNKFDRDNLQAEGFTKNKIDLERKGFIELEDLVRLLNIESGTFYRNRDIFLIFRRLTPSDRISFEEVLAQISA